MNNDIRFLGPVLDNLAELRDIIAGREWSDRALLQLADDIASVGLRLIHGRKCANRRCQADTKVEPIPTESFCSEFCRGAAIAVEIDTVARVEEAMQPYRGNQNAD